MLIKLERYFCAARLCLQINDKKMALFWAIKMCSSTCGSMAMITRSIMVTATLFDTCDMRLRRRA